MQTRLAPGLAGDSRASEAEAVLRKCVHCGFCLATCPTYNLLGDELDSPRGRIYLIKQVVEGHTPTRATQQHLDRCLTCRNCETTCPSGVEYAHLIDVGRSLVDEQVERALGQRVMRWLVRQSLPHRERITPLLKIGQAVRGVLPARLAMSIPHRLANRRAPPIRHARRMLVLQGCVQPVMAPGTNAAAARVLDALGISLQAMPDDGCCGAINHHLDDPEAARDFMRRNIDAWWPAVEQGAEAVLVTASGCGVMVKDYGYLLRDDPVYADRAARISELCRDTVQALVEALQGFDLEPFHAAARELGPIAFHPPCTLQHGQKLGGVTEALLARFGFELTPVADAHLCCGSAGTWSIFQPQLSQQLKRNKLRALTDGQPALVATANIGCQVHLQSGLGRPVLHWVELVEAVFDRTGYRF